MSLVKSADGRHAIELQAGHRMYGWVFARHPDGQWVTVRPATAEEIEAARLAEERRKSVW